MMRIFGAPFGYLNDVPLDGPTITAAAARAAAPPRMGTRPAGGAR